MLGDIEAAVSDELGVARDDLSTVVTHLLIVVGVVVFDWNVPELIIIYLIEVAVTCAAFGAVAAFAAQPVEDHDAEAWRTEPTPVRILPFLPPVHTRNLRLIATEIYNGGSVFVVLALMTAFVLDWSVSALVSPTAGLMILAICVGQGVRAWRQFLAGRSYEERSPAEALRIGFRPAARFTVTVLYVVVPITFVLGFMTVVVLDTKSLFSVPHAETAVLLMYAVPIGAASLWLRNDRLEVTLQYER
jgi:ABC-type sugar transport system permease subunit